MSDNLGAVLARPARLFGGRTAVIDGDQRWTYAELEQRVASFDAALDGFGLNIGDVVGVLSLNSAAHLVCWFGIPRSGRVLNDLNFRLAPAELQFICDDAAVRVLIVDDQFAAVGEQLAAACDSITQLVHAGSGPAPAGSMPFAQLLDGPGREPAPLDPDTLAGIFYTGGTTGMPKGAMLSHRNLVANAKHTIIGIGYRPDDVYLHAAPMFHLADGASTFALTWAGGVHAIIGAFDPALWLRTVAELGVTRALLVPTMINMVIHHPELGDHDLSSLRSLLYGASPMPAEVQRAAMKAMPCDWLQAYGMTEVSPVATFLTPEDHRRGITGEEPYATRLRSAGAPAIGVEVTVRRPDGTLADVGEPGEIWIRGANVMQGYWNRPEETAAVLDDEGWYHSGDAAYQDADGYVFVVDRVKDMIISGGENVYSVEVENAIYQHAGVLEAAVFGVPDERWGERVHAAIVLKDGATADEAEVIAHCRELIAGYKLPRSVEFRTEALPKSGAGKILKKDLRAPYWEGRARAVN
jgi:long-chain acyl-CoA synthetase